MKIVVIADSISVSIADSFRERLKPGDIAELFEVTGDPATAIDTALDTRADEVNLLLLERMNSGSAPLFTAWEPEIINTEGFNDIVRIIWTDSNFSDQELRDRARALDAGDVVDEEYLDCKHQFFVCGRSIVRRQHRTVRQKVANLALLLFQPEDAADGFTRFLDHTQTCTVGLADDLFSTDVFLTTIEDQLKRFFYQYLNDIWYEEPSDLDSTLTGIDVLKPKPEPERPEPENTESTRDDQPEDESADDATVEAQPEIRLPGFNNIQIHVEGELATLQERPSPIRAYLERELGKAEEFIKILRFRESRLQNMYFRELNETPGPWRDDDRIDWEDHEGYVERVRQAFRKAETAFYRMVHQTNSLVDDVEFWRSAANFSLGVGLAIAGFMIGLLEPDPMISAMALGGLGLAIAVIGGYLSYANSGSHSKETSVFPAFPSPPDRPKLPPVPTTAATEAALKALNQHIHLTHMTEAWLHDLLSFQEDLDNKIPQYAQSKQSDNLQVDKILGTDKPEQLLKDDRNFYLKDIDSLDTYLALIARTKSRELREQDWAQLVTNLTDEDLASRVVKELHRCQAIAEPRISVNSNILGIFVAVNDGELKQEVDKSYQPILGSSANIANADQNFILEFGQII